MINIAVLGCGKICHRFIKGLSFSKKGRLYGFASRDKEKAKQYAEMYHVDFYGNYKDAFENKEIDAVYISTINTAHYNLIVEALKAKKHVMCEKPMVETEEKYRTLFKIAEENGVLLMEAIKGVFLPINIEIKGILERKELGEVKYVHASYVHNGQYPADHWVLDKETGGCLQDVGSYPASVVTYILGKKPVKVEKKIDYYYDVAGFAEVIVDYQDGIKAELVSSITSVGPNYLEVCCSNGYIRALNYWKGNSYEIYQGVGKDLEAKVVTTEDFKTDFYYEAEHFIDCILSGKKQSEVVSLEFLLDLLKLTDKENHQEKR